TINRCTEHVQTTSNFCLSLAYQAVQAELISTYAKALVAAKTADSEKEAECKSGTGFVCGGGMQHEQYLKTAQAAWTEYADNQCSYETESNVGGTGYGAFGMICWLKLAADRIDQLGSGE
ncbi:MAG: DUF1311 domain-containing protein, partial [Erythrobacter sp.]|uniref:lysozyme inhibitor LprI family protein n=1 Tax=Erythrobacter sp. TaxID=1042 RepID=UPI0025E40D5B